MKLKIALIAATLTLTGCVMPNGPIYNASEVGKIRTQADVDARTGTLQWHNGTGVVYTRTPMQCGKNCANHAELAAKMDAERAAEQPREDYLRAVAKNRELDRNTRIADICAKGTRASFKGQADALIAQRPSMSNYKKSYEYSAAFSVWKQKYTKLQTTILKTENNCNREGRNDKSFN